MNELAERILAAEQEWQKEVANLDEAEEMIEKKEQEIELLEQTQADCQIVASSIQQVAHKQIARIVEKCLSTIFDEPYKFEIVFERKRGKTEAKPVFIRDGQVIDKPLKGSGGGAIDIAAMALRLASIILTKPKQRKILILDEPFKFVSQRYRKNIAQMLKELSEGYGIQIIMVTHVEELKIGTIYQL